MRTNALLATLLGAAIVGVAVAGQASQQNPQQPQRPTAAIAVIFATDGSKVSGTVHFMQMEGGVHVIGEISGLAPNSTHGFHIHEFGDMTKRDGMGMGGHFNPAGVAHGLPDAAMHHEGDMGNITADANGVAKIDQMFMGMAIGGRGSILGRGVVVHEKADDGGQPVGNAGARVGYGVIGVAQAATS